MGEYSDYYASLKYESAQRGIKEFGKVWQRLEEARLLLPNGDLCPARVHESLATTQDMVLARISVLQNVIKSYEEE